MVTLAEVMLGMVNGTSAARVADPAVYISLARIHEEAGDLEGCAACYERALADHLPLDLRRQAHTRLSLLFPWTFPAAVGGCGGATDGGGEEAGVACSGARPPSGSRVACSRPAGTRTQPARAGKTRQPSLKIRGFDPASGRTTDSEGDGARGCPLRPCRVLEATGLHKGLDNWNAT